MLQQNLCNVDLRREVSQLRSHLQKKHESYDVCTIGSSRQLYKMESKMFEKEHVDLS